MRAWHSRQCRCTHARPAGLPQVLPVENLDGRQAWESGNLCLRKTPKGVDLNRNYPFAFVNEVCA